MKLAVTQKYIQELQQQYCPANKTYTPGYGINRLFFNYFNMKPRIMFFAEDEIIVVNLSAMSLKVKDAVKISINDATNIVFKKGGLMNKLRVYQAGNCVYKTLINKKIFGLGDIQKNCNIYLQKYKQK